MVAMPYSPLKVLFTLGNSFDPGYIQLDMWCNKNSSRQIGQFKARCIFAFAVVLFVVSCSGGNDPASSRIAVADDDDDDDVLETPFEVTEVRFADSMAGMCLVPEGLGPYGCDHQYNETCEETDVELHLVNLSPFFIDIHEVTWSEYDQCVETGECVENPCSPESGGDDLPVGCVNAEDAKAYCQWAGKRLPTDVEWERAARGLSGSYYPWGNEWCESCLNWCDGSDECDGSVDNFSGPAPVASFPDGVSPYGALDMAGNVWEITEGNLGQGDEMTPTVFVRGGGYAHGDVEIPEDYLIELYRTYRRAVFDEETMVGEFLGFRCAVEAEYE